MPRTISAMMVAAGMAAMVSTSHAQRADSSRASSAPSGAFVGVIKNSVTGAHVQSADLRLYYIDSARVVRGAKGDSASAKTASTKHRMSIDQVYVTPIQLTNA